MKLEKGKNCQKNAEICDAKSLQDNQLQLEIIQ